MMKQEANKLRKYNQGIKEIIESEANAIYSIFDSDGGLYAISGKKIITYGDFNNDGTYERNTSSISEELEILGIIPEDPNKIQEDFKKHLPNPFLPEKTIEKKKVKDLLVYNN